MSVETISSGQKRGGLIWTLWFVVSVLPLLAYANPLWSNLLADTPIADLMWIPLIALGWASWNIATTPQPSSEDSDLNVIAGAFLCIVAGATLVLAPERWPATFVYDHVGLLLWPVWIIGVTSLFWGVSATRRILAPMIYLLLVWPPIFEGIANTTQQVLVSWADAILTALARSVSWLQTAQPAGTYAVEYHHHPFLVVVAQACSGADSLLGSAIIIPVIWFVFRGPIRNKAWLTGITLAGALVINWVRLALIVLAVHVIGPGVTFSYIHPVLGFVLFALLVALVAGLFRPFHLTLPARQNTRGLPLPSWGRVVTGSVLAVMTSALLVPLFSLPRGSFGDPSPVMAYNVRTFLPRLAAFTRQPVYYANEDSVLGSGSATQADLYLPRQGLGQVTVEMWSTPNANALATYGFHACLLYHGDNLSAVRSFQLVPGVVATAYAVALPPNQVGGKRSTYVDVEWNNAVVYHGRIHYMRWSIAAFPGAVPSRVSLVRTDPRLLSLSPVQAMVAPASSGHWGGPVLETRQTLVALAQEIFYQSTRVSGAETT